MNAPTQALTGAPVSDLHAAALAYAARGWPVFPCVPNGKVPPEGSRGYQDATTDTDIINAWWTENPDFNVGLCPEDVGLAVLDEDSAKGGDIAPLQLPETRTVETPSGGRHYYFVGSVPPTVGKLGPHIDTRGQKSYVLVPPSRVNGRPYHDVNDREPVALPAEIEAKLATRAQAGISSVHDLDLPGNVATGRRKIADLIARKDVAIEGQGGDNRTYQLACELVRDLGLGVDTAMAVIEPWNAACVPPWEPDELRAKLEHAAEYGQNEPGTYATAPASEVFQLPAETTALRRSDRFLMTAADVLTLPTPEPLVTDFLMQHENAAMYGPEKLGKSFAALDLALSVAANVPVFGSLKVRRPGPVVYLTGEGQFGFKARLLAWGRAHNIDVNKLPFYFKAEVPRAMDGVEQSYVEGIRQQIEAGPVLIIFDTLANSIVGEDENGSKALSRYWSMVQTISMNLGAATLTLAHTGKDEAKGIRGWSGTGGTIDRSIEVEGDRDAKTLKLHHRYAKDTPDFPDVHLRLATVAGSGISSAVVEAIGKEQFEAKGAPGSDGIKAMRTTLADKMLELEIFSRTEGRLLDDMANVMAGPEPRDDNAEERIQWQTRRSAWREKLKRGTRERSGGKGRPKSPAQFRGLFTLEDLTNSGTLQPLFWMPKPDTANEELS